MKERTATIITAFIFACPILGMVSCISNHREKNPSVEATKPSEYDSNYTKPKFTIVASEYSSRWGRYPLYMSEPNQPLPASFEVKSMGSDVCDHFKKESGYSYGPYDAIMAYGLSWSEYKGKWIAFSQIRSEGKGWGRHSIAPGYYPYCAAGSSTNSVKFKIYVGDRGSLIAQHKKEKIAHYAKLNQKEEKLKSDIAKVGL
jgi:hypothetical protein